MRIVISGLTGALAAAYYPTHLRAPLAITRVVENGRVYQLGQSYEMVKLLIL